MVLKESVVFKLEGIKLTSLASDDNFTCIVINAKTYSKCKRTNKFAAERIFKYSIGLA